MDKTVVKIVLAFFLVASSLIILSACSPEKASSLVNNPPTASVSLGSSANLTETTNSAAQTEASNTQTEQSTDKRPVYPLDTDVTFTIAIDLSDYVESADQWQKTLFWQEWQNQTGVKLELVEPQGLNGYLLSGVYPDIISSSAWTSIDGGVARLVEYGFVAPITDYMDSLALDYKEKITTNEEWQKASRTADGQIPGFYHLRTDEPGVANTYGMVIRQDWLDELGLAPPATLEDFESVLSAFKTQKNAQSPFSVSLSDLKRMGTYGILTSPFNLVATDYYHTGGQAHYGAAEPQYKDYLIWLNRLLTEGLLSQENLTIGGQGKKENVLDGKAGVTAVFADEWKEGWLEAAQAKQVELAGLASLTKNSSEKPAFSQRLPLCV